jgi:hypothetical protein
VTSIKPAAGPAKGGNTVVITGLGLFGAGEVRFGTTSASGLMFTSPTQIAVVVPPGANGTTVDVTIVGPDGESLTTFASKYTYGPPLVTSVTPGVGPALGLNSVTILGSGFTGLTGDAAVRFGPRNAISYQVVSDTKIVAKVPSAPAGTSVAVTVTNPAGTSPPTAIYMYYGR